MELLLKLAYWLRPSEDLSNRICAVRFHKKWPEAKRIARSWEV